MTERLSDETRETLLAPLLNNGWEETEDGKGIAKSFEFADFADAFGWMTRAAIWAEKWDHHPEWFHVYKTVKVTLTTHDVDGLSPLDIKLARKMDSLAD